MSAAQCFYPNGDPSKENDIPCGSGSGVGCCPSGWACQVNGLCYLASQQYYGRYTCTDKSWKSPGCPQICTYDNTASGNEAVLECSTGNYCCDTNRPELSGGQACCNASTERFSIDGNAAMTMMSEAPSSATTVSNTPHTTSAPPSSQSTGTLNPTSVVVVTSVLDQDGQKVTVTSTPTVTSSPVNDSHGSQPNHLGSIIAGVVVAAIAIMVIATITFFLLRWRRRRNSPSHPFRKFSLKDDLDPMYRNTRSLKSIFKSDTPSELIGSVPDLSSSESVGEKDWEKRYESPSDFGKLLLPQPSASNLRKSSLVSQTFPDDNKEHADIPSPNEQAKPGVVYEMPERSNTRKLGS